MTAARWFFIFMRIIAGIRKGMSLKTVEHAALRPTKDIVKEFIFNCLANLTDISACRVCDLFAGTGGLGIEALSRGAVEATFVENDPVAGRLIRENLDKSRLSDQAVFIHEDALRWLDKPCARAFDIIMADPPYALRCGNFIVEKVRANGYLTPRGVLVLETDPAEDVAIPDDWSLIKKRKWGNTLVRIIKNP